MGTKNTETQIKHIKEQFPLKFSDTTTLFLLNENIDVAYNEKLKCKKYRLNLIDNEGYKYYADYNLTMNTLEKIKNPTRFFYNNKYTYDNINHFCELNNIDLSVDGTGLPLSGYAREKLCMVNSNGEVHKISWNQLQHYTFQYQDGYEDVKKINYDETHMTKEKASEIIYDLYNKLKRPLLQRDFRGVQTTENTVGIRIIYRHWGNFTSMIKELGLPEHDYYYKPFDKNYVPHNEIINGIHKVCKSVSNSGRTTIMCSDFMDVNIVSDMTTLKRHCELENTTLNKIIESYGCIMQPSGNGLNHIFSDGEKVVSKYEYDFSMYLRHNGLVFGKDYFRDIRYKNIDEVYTGNMNCDYKIIVNDVVIYIELAGILGNKEHQIAYRENTPIKSKSKELYRTKLNEKRDMFERNNLEYYILLPDEMNETTYKEILSKYIKEVA